MNIPIRSFLFVPGDSERKLEKSRDCQADALIFDLEDAVAPERKSLAREMVARHLETRSPDDAAKLWVRINPLSSGLAIDDLKTVFTPRLAGIVLPKAEGPGDVARVNERLDELDPEQRVEILPIVTETARAVLTLSRYLDSELSRLYGMSWGAEDLSAELGAVSNRDSNGQFSFTYRMARSQALLTARALQAEAVDTVFTDFRDLDGLRIDSLESYREGFSGRLAIHPEQVEIINRCYSPDQEAVDQAERIVNAFESNPDAGTVGLDGRMLDRPHLAQARKVLAMAEVLNQADRR